MKCDECDVQKQSGLGRDWTQKHMPAKDLTYSLEILISQDKNTFIKLLGERDGKEAKKEGQN